ncbi:MAG: CHAT domain-containing protein, partial [Trebonia sp.]
MTPPENEEQALEAALTAFHASPDPAAAARVADAYPILRDPYVVATLIVAARRYGDDRLTELLFSGAKILCGPGWPDGPVLVTDIVTSINAIAESPLDPEFHRQAVNAARAIWQSLDRADPHPLLLARVLGAISWTFAQSHAVTGESLWREALLHLARLYEVTGDRGLLEEAVTMARKLVRAMPASSPDRPTVLTNLAEHLARLSAATGGDRGLLEEATEVARDLVRTTPTSRLARHLALGYLENRLADLYMATGDRGVLEEAVEVGREAIRAMPAASADRPDHLNNLANRLASLYEATDERGLLEEAVAVAREAVRAMPASSTERPTYLNNLANHLAVLYEATGNGGVLDEAVAVAREAAQSTPASSTDRPGNLSNLANRLASLYEATGNRELLEEAVTIAREAAQTAPASSSERPGILTTLASHLASLYEATGNRELLEEAVTITRAVAETMPVPSVDRPIVLSNLAKHLASLYEATGNRGLLDEAVAITREVVEATPGSSTKRPALLNNLGSYLNHLYEATGDRGLLEEAVGVAREAVRAMPASSADRPGALTTLASHLAGLYEATGDRGLLDEAGELVAGVRGNGPWDRELLAQTRARLIRADEHRNDRYTATAAELTDALNVFQDQLQRPDLSLRERRDLAQRCDGLLGDLAASRVRGGDISQGLELIEGPRLWLPQPPERPGKLPETPLPVAWVMPSQWETAVVTCTDHRDQQELAIHIVNRTRAQIHNAVAAALNAARRASGETPEVAQDAIMALCGVASEIAAAVPPAERLLIVPLGISALLPYAAASRPDGTYLVDGTAVTVAPSLAWARAAHRQRPDGRRVGAFHPGKPSSRPLALGEDRTAFEDLLRGEVLDRPTAQKALEHFGPDTDIGHISCHGSYNALKPWESSLELETDLTLRAVLDHGTAPWLVNLSACETGIPDLQASEQQISFPTGFILGGAAHALATLWPIGNVHATIANRAFYHRLTEGEHPADALRHAINGLRRGTRVATAST